MRWPKGPPHLALNSPYLLFLVFFALFLFLSFLCFLIQKNLVCSPRKGHFCLFLSVSLCFSLAFFGLPLFKFLFLFLSLVLVLFSSFSSFFFAFFWFLVLVSFFPFLSSLLLFHERKNIKVFNCKKLLHQYFLFFGFLSCFFFQIPFSYLSFFLILSYVFLFNINVFGFKKTKVEKQQFLVKRGVATKRRFFINLCFAKYEKLSFLGGCPFLGKFWVLFKKHYKKRYFSTFLKPKIAKK